MGIIADMMRVNDKSGYTGANLTAKVCQDIVLKAIAESNLNRNVTISKLIYDLGINNIDYYSFRASIINHRCYNCKERY